MSIKLRVTAWFTLMLLLLTAMAVTFVFAVSGAVIGDPAGELVRRVQRNAGDVEYDGRVFDWSDVDFYKNGVYCCVFDGTGAFLQGASPIDEGFTLPAEAGGIRSVSAAGGEYYVYDTYVDRDGAGLWVRGIISAGDRRAEVVDTVSTLLWSLLPPLLVLSVAGGWLVAWLSFRPMEKILAAASSISDGDDLSARVGLARGPAEMKRLSRTFDGMFARLERSFHAEKQFASDASHELRTPIAVILAECDRARRKDETKADFLRTVDVVEQQGRRMSGLVDQLLSLTRLRQGTERYPLRRAELSGFVSACCGEFVPGDARGITLETDIEDGVEAAYNPSLFSRVLQNLLQNAYKYGREGGHIQVALRQTGDGPRLTVRDDGIGIAPEDQGKIWQRFWQADASRGEDGGSGLGLAMVREITEFHGGTVSVESVPGEGSVFTVALPK